MDDETLKIYGYQVENSKKIAALVKRNFPKDTALIWFNETRIRSAHDKCTNCLKIKNNGQRQVYTAALGEKEKCAKSCKVHCRAQL